MSDRYIVNQYTIEDGLLQSSVTDLYIGPRGYLWVGSQGGLCRFDGQYFFPYTSSNSIIAGARILGLGGDSRNRVFFSVLKKGANIYYVDRDMQVRQEAKFNKGFYILPRNGDPLVCDSLIRCMDENGDYRVFDLQKYIRAGIKRVIYNDELYFVFRDSVLWINTSTKRFARISMSQPVQCVLVKDTLLMWDENWQCTGWRGGTPCKAVATTASLAGLQQKLGRSNNKKILTFCDYDDDAGYLREGSNIWRISLVQGRYDAELLYAELDLAVDASALCYDRRTDVLFIGTATNGLFMVRKNLFRTIFFQNEVNARNNVYSQVQVNEHTLLNWYFLYDLSGKVQKRIEQPLTGTGFFKDAQGNIWYSRPGSIVIVDSQLRQKNIIKIPRGQRNEPAKVIAEDQDHRIWVATNRSLGYIDKGRVQFLFFESPYFISNNISGLFFPDRERIWIGCGEGVLVYNKKTGKFEATKLSGMAVVSIFRASDSSIWLSTYGKGIFKYVAGQFVPLPVDPADRVLYTHCFVEDGEGFFWLPTNNGLIQCRKAELDKYAAGQRAAPVYYYLHRKTGVYTDEFNGGGSPSSIVMADKVILPSIKGALLFQPSRIKPVFGNVDITVEKIRVNEQNIPVADSVVLAAGVQRLEVSVSAPYFGDQINHVMEYRLKELSGTWFPVVKNTIIYNRLAYGDYHLQVRERIGFGSGDFAFKELHFSIQPYWYENWKVKALATLLLALSVLIVVRLRITSLKKTQKMLEQKVAERTAELEIKVEELNVSEEELYKMNQVQEQAISIILHDIRSPLNHLSRLATNFNNSIGVFSREEISAYARSLMESSGGIAKLSDHLVEWLSLHYNNDTINYQWVELMPVLDNIRKLYTDIAAANNTVIEIGTRSILPVRAWTDANKIDLVVRNLVDNATKHCQNGTIVLTAIADEVLQHTKIIVADTGEGMTEAELGNWKLQMKKVPDFRKPKLGLSMAFHFVRMMGGNLHIESVKEKGTTVTITLPEPERKAN